MTTLRFTFGNAVIPNPPPLPPNAAVVRRFLWIVATCTRVDERTLRCTEKSLDNPRMTAQVEFHCVGRTLQDLQSHCATTRRNHGLLGSL